MAGSSSSCLRNIWRRRLRYPEPGRGALVLPGTALNDRFALNRISLLRVRFLPVAGRRDHWQRLGGEVVIVTVASSICAHFQPSRRAVRGPQGQLISRPPLQLSPGSIPVTEVTFHAPLALPMRS